MNRVFHAENAGNYPCDPYQELAIAVIRQAADDYRSLGRKSIESGSTLEQKNIRQQMIEISRFFLSDWYGFLSGLDNGAEVLELLDVEVFGID